MESFGRFRIVRQIAAGGSAQLQLAIEALADGRSRAIVLKRLLPAQAADPSFVRAFRDEGRILASLAHPNVVRLYEAGAIDGVLYQALELVEGADAERFSAFDDAIPQRAALCVAREVARALSFAHARGIVHRDVTPENILISWTGDVKLCDFGIALAPEREERTAFGIAKGKLGYMAPEQLRGEAVDARADVFALGCVLHRMIAGASPIASAAERDALLGGRPIVLAAGISAEVAAVLVPALRADRAARMASAEAFVAACDAVLVRSAAARPLEAWLDALETAVEEKRARHPARELIDFELVLERGAEGLDRSAISIAAPEAELETAALPKLGEYFLREMIGRGSTAIVYRAAHPRFGERIALKVLRANVAGVARLRRRFVRESRMLAAIDHPNVVRVHEAGEADGALYLATEFLEGRSLRQVIEEEAPLSAERIALIAAQIARGLAAAHRLGIVHRDLKPANVMIAGARAKIVDFGIAKSLATAAEETSLTRNAGLLGTPGFMAPEQIAAPSQVTPATDLYALGRVMLEMGARGSLESIARALSAADPAARPESAEAAAEMIERAVDPSPRIAELRDGQRARLEVAFDGTPPSPSDALLPLAARSPSDAPMTATGVRALRADFAAIAALLVALAALIATVAYLRTSPPSPSPIAEVVRERLPSPVIASPIASPRAAELAPAREDDAQASKAAGDAAQTKSVRDTDDKSTDRAPADRAPRDTSNESASADRTPRDTTNEPVRREKRADIAAILATRKLRLDDLESSDPGRAWLERFRDPATKSAAVLELPALVERLPIDSALILRRLERISAAIRANRTALTATELQTLETAYFEQRSALQRRSATESFDAVLTLEAQLARALLAPIER